MQKCAENVDYQLLTEQSLVVYLLEALQLTETSALVPSDFEEAALHLLHHDPAV